MIRALLKEFIYYFSLVKVRMNKEKYALDDQQAKYAYEKMIFTAKNRLDRSKQLYESSKIVWRAWSYGIVDLDWSNYEKQAMMLWWFAIETLCKWILIQQEKEVFVLREWKRSIKKKYKTHNLMILVENTWYQISDCWCKKNEFDCDKCLLTQLSKYITIGRYPAHLSYKEYKNEIMMKAQFTWYAKRWDIFDKLYHNLLNRYKTA